MLIIFRTSLPRCHQHHLFNHWCVTFSMVILRDEFNIALAYTAERAHQLCAQNRWTPSNSSRALRSDNVGPPGKMQYAAPSRSNYFTSLSPASYSGPTCIDASGLGTSQCCCHNRYSHIPDAHRHINNLFTLINPSTCTCLAKASASVPGVQLPTVQYLPELAALHGKIDAIAASVHQALQVSTHCHFIHMAWLALICIHASHPHCQLSASHRKVPCHIPTMANSVPWSHPVDAFG